jgi:tellurite resistance protein TerB
MSKLTERAMRLLERHRERVRSRQFLDAVMAAGALVASADGEVSLAELLSRDDVLQRVDALKSFDAHEAVDIFRDHVRAIEANREVGTERALKSLAPVGSDAASAQLLLRVAVAIAKADSDFSPVEQRAIARICEALGCEELDLNADD